jgi:hypothetical protein
MTPGSNIAKLFSLSLMRLPNMHYSVSLASIYSLVDIRGITFIIPLSGKGAVRFHNVRTS